jgi:phosphatidylethanolamine-binding protein (PEBP) family uncharacterized protein
MSSFALRSAAFDHGMPIPRRHTCQGEDVSPALEWTGRRSSGPRRRQTRARSPSSSRTPTRRAARLHTGSRDVDDAVSGHVLAAAELIGTFER